jgi:hypothetical protein
LQDSQIQEAIKAWGLQYLSNYLLWRMMRFAEYWDSGAKDLQKADPKKQHFQHSFCNLNQHLDTIANQ